MKIIVLSAVAALSLMTGAVATSAFAAQPPATPPAPNAAPAQTADLAKGEATYNARCKMCHGNGAGPDRATLASFKTDHIVEALTTGAMVSMASGLSVEDKANVAAFLTAPAPAQAPVAAN